MDGFKTPSKIDLRYAEKKILFLICDCSLDKHYSFYGLTREEATRFLRRLQHLEQMTWSQFSALTRDHGLTVENPSSESFAMIDQQNTSLQRFGEKYYFHFRIEQDGLFRVFGYQREEFFCITHIDVKGRIHH